MKKVLVLALIMFTVEGHAQNTCSSLFSAQKTATESRPTEPHGTEEISQSLAQESVEFITAFRTHKEVLDTREISISARTLENADAQFLSFREAFRHFNQRLIPLWEEILSLRENQSAPISDRRSLENTKELNRAEKSFYDEMNGYVLRTSEFLSAIGVNHSIVFRRVPEIPESHSLYIIISTTGENLVNRLARGLYEDRFYQRSHVPGYQMQIRIDPAELAKENSKGFFLEDGDLRPISLNPYIFAQDSLYRNSTGLHETVHAISDWLRDIGYIKPYHAEIRTLELTQKTQDKLNGYEDFFSVDEILAFRVSIRTLIRHMLIMTYEPGLYEAALRDIKMDIKRIVVFSEITNEIFKEIQNIESRRSYTEDVRNLKVSVEGDKFHVLSPGEVRAEDTIVMTNFTTQLYTAIGKKLDDISDHSRTEQRQALKKIARVLSLHEVKKLDGNYPSMEKVHQMLNE